MKRTKFLALLMAVMMLVTCFSACNNDPSSETTSPTGKTPGTSQQPSDDPPITFTMFIAGAMDVPPASNKILQKIKELTGVTIEFEPLVGDMEQKVGTMIAGGDYPDLLGAGQARGNFLNGNSFLALDDYLPNYPNLWKHYEPYLDELRSVSQDGKIYILDIWGRRYYLNDGEDQLYEADYNGPAFWIQKDVLAWDNYSSPETLDEFFDLLERYYEAHPTIDGQPTLPFEIHSVDWRSFSLKNPPQHLIGGRNEGDVVIDTQTLDVEIYQNKWYAKKYYGKLNEEFKKGLINAETFTRSYDEYMNVLSTGRVLAMFDQQWSFGSGEDVLKADGKWERMYVPLGITFDGPAASYNRQTAGPLIGGNGMGISVDCKDVERALKFMDQLLSEEIQTLLFWGIEGEDYYVTEDGRYRRTPEQKALFDDKDWRIENAGVDFGNQFPKMEGRYSNGNAVGPGGQPEEKLENQSAYDKEFLGKYGYSSKSEFLPIMQYPGYPEAWSIFSTMPSDNPAKVIFDEITDLENRYLPNVIMANNFDIAWAEYVARYENVDYTTLESIIKEEVTARYKAEFAKPID